MTTMIKKRVAELEGAQLDWAVAKAERLQFVSIGCPSGQHDGGIYSAASPMGFWKAYRPSVHWRIGGPIIERELIELHAPASGVIINGLPMGWTANYEWGPTAGYEGKTPLIAAMRAFVASKRGDEVEVPE